MRLAPARWRRDVHALLVLVLYERALLVGRQLLELEHAPLVLLDKLRLVDLDDEQPALAAALDALRPTQLSREVHLEGAREQLIALLVQQADVAHVHPNDERETRGIVIVIVQGGNRPISAGEELLEGGEERLHREELEERARHAVELGREPQLLVERVGLHAHCAFVCGQLGLNKLTCCCHCIERLALRGVASEDDMSKSRRLPQPLLNVVGTHTAQGKVEPQQASLSPSANVAIGLDELLLGRDAVDDLVGADRVHVRAARLKGDGTTSSAPSAASGAHRTTSRFLRSARCAFSSDAAGTSHERSASREEVGLARTGLVASSIGRHSLTTSARGWGCSTR